ncbi:SRPBCC family protein [Nocardioides lentus]|uniref:SRPBCC family protein n=1 Tax=Nocardioides lentus TaxID=338077 RepID=A0ABN2PLT8_9ACTN
MSETRITVQRTIDAASPQVFDVLSLPQRHPELDTSGTVVSVDHGDRITAVGQTFRMNMHAEMMGGDYQTDNHVTGYQENHLLAWETAPAGTEPPGWEWVWQLEAQGPDATRVTLTYDWEKVTDPELLKKISFPLIPAADLEGSLEALAAAVSG